MAKAQNTYDSIVIGGGAAGMMAAVILGSRKKRVLLLEKNNKLGEKLRISGGGRCNILNAEEDTRELLSHFKEADKFLFSTFSQFGMKETWDFFELHGLPLMVEDRKRAFPRSEDAEDVCELFKRLLQENNVEVRKKMEVTRIIKKGKKIVEVVAGGEHFGAETFIFATGGTSHPETGSTGDGFNWLKEVGHTAKDPVPTIVPIKLAERWVKKLSGVELPDVKITFSQKKEKKFSIRGKILITHFGLSGPTILNNAGKIQDLLYEGSVTGHIDLFPDLSLGDLHKKIFELFEEHKNKTVKNTFKEIFQDRLAEALAGQFPRLDEELQVNAVTKTQRIAIIEYLKKVPITVTELMGEDRAVIADGGVPLTEIDMREMRSKVVDNLFIVGDLLHINRPTGGYSLQLCWTTGYVAGMHA
ncbi:MAG: NAD(P)/FAD-dependent oxidoreductase [Patescibacteria group bacterium UBA2103]